jgi:hypothetical protein
MEGAQKINPPSDSADVTLASLVCKHFQTGYCKFGDKCRKKHMKEICKSADCNSKSCVYRHPRVCKFFSMLRCCKFGENCAYKHEVSQEESSIQNLVSQVKQLVSTIKEMSEKINYLEELCEVKGEPVPVSFKCNQCNYECASSTVLKSHMTKKHKCETLRSAGPEDDSRHLSPEKEAPRAADPSTTLESKCTTEASSTVVSKCTIAVTLMENRCHICNNFFNKESDFKMHMVHTHSFSENIDVCQDCDGAIGCSSDIAGYWAMADHTIAAECVACRDANTCYE